ncbi:MAG: aldose 1-epimerase family protein [Clostridia bacterium]|nr:aldose 1-epimerase family protein [Clostridia bacterium]
MITIKNEYITAVFSELGAELKSVQYGGREYIWNSDAKYWAESSPILFPICSRLKDDEYILDGKAYPMGMHGFAKKSLFEAESAGKDNVTFLLKSNKETLKSYPFSFELRIKYLLEGKKLRVLYEVKNLSEKEMYFSIGAHEGYFCPEGIEEYDIVFDKKTTLKASVLENKLLGDKKLTVIENGDVLPLKNKYFEIDALIFKNIDFSGLKLRKKDGLREIRVCFNGFPYLLLWTKCGAPYICIEPWCGITDNINTDKNIKTKEGINSIAPNDIWTIEHSFEILK